MFSVPQNPVKDCFLYGQKAFWGNTLRCKVISFFNICLIIR